MSARVRWWFRQTLGFTSHICLRLSLGSKVIRTFSLQPSGASCCRRWMWIFLAPVGSKATRRWTKRISKHRYPMGWVYKGHRSFNWILFPFKPPSKLPYARRWVLYTLGYANIKSKEMVLNLEDLTSSFENKHNCNITVVWQEIVKALKKPRWRSSL